MNINFSERQEIFLKRSSKALSLILSLILLITPVLGITSQAVTYPAGVTEAQVLSVIPKLNNMVKGIMNSMMGSGGIKGTVYRTLYADATMNSLFSGIYSALGENADTLSMIGADVSPAALAEALSDYPGVAKKLRKCNNISEAVAASKNFQWDITTQNGFKNAVADMLSPFNDLLNVILCSGTLKINDLISIKGDDGYSSAIVPLLQAFDCPSIMSASEFASDAAKNKRNILKNIIDMVFSSLDKLLDDPVIGMCSTLPKIAYYFDSGKLSASLSTLLEPLSLKIAGIITIPGLSDLISNVANLDATLDINSMLSDADLSGLFGEDISLPPIDMKAFAACVTDNSGTLTVDKGAAFITLMNMVCDMLKSNSGSLGSVLGGEEAAEMLKPLISKSNDELIKSIITLFSVNSVPENNYQWNYPAFTPGTVTYTPTLGYEDYQKILDKFDPLITDFIRESDPEGNVEDTLRKTIFSSKTLSEIVVGVYSMLGSEEMSGLFSMLGIAVSPYGVASAVSSSYPYAANTLYRYGSWKNVNPAYISWGFADGDSKAFSAALAKALSPFVPLFTCLLAGENVTFMNALTVPGADGYNTAVIPILEALGCKNENIVPYSEYKKGAGTIKVLTDILAPVTALLEEVCASPVKTICTILPNIIYFLENSLMEEAIKNLIYPINQMLTQAGMGDLLSGVTSAVPEIDMNSLIKEMSSSMDLGITLPEIDVSVLGTYGNAVTRDSKRVSGGAPSQYTYIEADTSAVLVTLLRVVAQVITSPENGDLLTGFMGGSGDAGGNDMFAMYAGDISKKFEGMTDDEVLEWLCDLFFSDSPTRDLPDENAEIPTIIYKEKFELSTTAKILIVVGLIAVAALIYYILSVSGKLDNHKLKKSKKKEMKRREEESKKLIKAGGSAVAPLENAPGKAKNEKKAAKQAQKDQKAAMKAAVAEQRRQMNSQNKKPAANNAPGTLRPGVQSQYLDPLSPSGKQGASAANQNNAQKNIQTVENVRPQPQKPVQPQVNPASKPANPPVFNNPAPDSGKISRPNPYLDPLSPSQQKKEEKREQRNDARANRIAAAKMPDKKQEEKLERRMEKAQKLNEKNELKAKKQYDKILKQAQKENNSKGGKA